MENVNHVELRPGASPGTGALFVIDARRSRFTVQAFAAGILSAMGHNPTIGIRSFAGQVEFDPDGLRASDFQLAIQAASLTVLDDISDKDRREIERVMKTEVLETKEFPEIRFEAPAPNAVNRIESSLFSTTLNGNLSLNGITRGESISVRIILMGEMLRASGDFSLKQSNYKIRSVSFAGGALKLKDELKFSFEMVANKQDKNA